METLQNDFAECDTVAVSGEKCPGCGDNLQFDPVSGALKCPSCGTIKQIAATPGMEFELRYMKKASGGWSRETHVYHCSNCNAEQALDKREIARVCPFCGSPSVVEREEFAVLRPDMLLPFSVGKQKAAETASHWAKKRLFAPDDFKKSFRAETLNGVYLPAFTFDAETYTDYSGVLCEHYTETVTVNGKPETRRRTRTFSVSGDYQKSFNDFAVSATDVVPPRYINKIMYYDYHNSVLYEEDFLYGFSARLGAQDGETCWAQARAQMETEVKRDILGQYSYDTVERFDMRTAYGGVTYRYLLIPIYLGNYFYKTKRYSFYINGRNGKMAGKSPVSALKVALAVTIGLAVAALAGLALYFLMK